MGPTNWHTSGAHVLGGKLVLEVSNLVGLDTRCPAVPNSPQCPQRGADHQPAGPRLPGAAGVRADKANPSRRALTCSGAIALAAQASRMPWGLPSGSLPLLVARLSRAEAFGQTIE